MKYPKGPYRIRHAETGLYSTLRLPMEWVADGPGTTLEGIRVFVRKVADHGFTKMIPPAWRHVHHLYEHWEIVGDDVPDNFLQSRFRV